MADFLRKNEISKILGMTKSTIRFYEQEGLITPHIDDNNYRRYSIEDLKKLSQINFMRSLDFDLDTIKSLLSGEMNELESVLLNRKSHLENMILDLQKKSKDLDAIIEISSSKKQHYSYDLKAFSKRSFYELSPNDQSLSSILENNEDFFSTNHLELGSWFVNVTTVDSVYKEDDMGFTEYIEVNSNVTVDSARHLTIEAGMYLCINLVLDEVHTLEWEEIKSTVSRIISSEQLRVRGSKMLFLNKDNMNFNFIDSKRMLSIQIPIQ